MVGSRRRRQLRQARAWRDDPDVFVDRLPADLLADIHRRLPFLNRLAFASLVAAASPGGGHCHGLRPEPPWLVLPGRAGGSAALLSVADGGRPAVVRAPAPAMRGHVVLGSGGGWLVTADAGAALRMANPATGEQAELPAIATTGLFLKSDHWYILDTKAFAQLRFGGPAPPDDETWGSVAPRTYTVTADQMRQWFYRKVVLSASPRPGRYAAMLILDPSYGAPAFATSEDPIWRVAPSRDGVEDAIHHGGRFYSITYSGVVEAWDSDAETGGFTSTVVAARLDVPYGGDDNKVFVHRKYLAATSDGRLVAVLKGTRVVMMNVNAYGYGRRTPRHFFEVRVLDEARRRWEKAADIGDAAVFVGVNGSLCVSTREYPGIRAGCIYFTDDEVGAAAMRHLARPGYSYPDDLPYMGVYSLSDGAVETIPAVGKYPIWPPAAWVTPSFV